MAIGEMQSRQKKYSSTNWLIPSVKLTQNILLLSLFGNVQDELSLSEEPRKVQYLEKTVVLFMQ